MNRFQSQIRALILGTVSIFCFCLTAAKGDNMHFWARQSGGDVILYYQGSVNLAGFPQKEPGVSAINTSEIDPYSGIFKAGSDTGDSRIDIYESVLPRFSLHFGSGNQDFYPNSDTLGSRFGFDGGGAMYLPYGYRSHSAISGSIRVENETLASMGISPTKKVLRTEVGTNNFYFFTSPAEFNEGMAKITRIFNRGIRKLNKLKRKAKARGQLSKVRKAKRGLKQIKKVRRKLLPYLRGQA